MGKRRRLRQVSRHASIKAAGYCGPRRSALAPWLRLETKSERALGPGATVGVLGTGVPRLACLRLTAWLHQRPSFGSNNSRTARGAKPREADDTKTFLGAASLGWLPRSRDIYEAGTSRGSRDVSHDDQGQAGVG